MKLNIDADYIKAQGERLVSLSNRMYVSDMNFSWQLRLPLSETLMIQDEIKAHEKQEFEKQIGREIAQDEYLRFKEIPHKRFEIDQYYSIDAKSDLGWINSGVTPPNTKYDPHLTVEQAYAKYLGLDAATVDRIEFMINKASDRTVDYIAGIREQWTENKDLDLATLLGRDRAEYERREMAIRTGDATVITSEFVPEDNGPGAPRV